MSSVPAIFEEVGTNRRILVNFGQVTRVQAGGTVSVIRYSDGSTSVVRATFDEACARFGVPEAGV
jgi:hypothetical protein